MVGVMGSRQVAEMVARERASVGCLAWIRQGVVAYEVCGESVRVTA